MPAQSSEMELVSEETGKRFKITEMRATAYPRARGLANSYFCPVGPDTGHGYVLLQRSQLVALQKEVGGPDSRYFPTVTLRLRTIVGSRGSQGGQGSGARTITQDIINLSIERAWNVAGRAGDDRAIYCCHLVPTIWLYAKYVNNFAGAYNLRAELPSAYGTSITAAEAYHADTLNSGSLFTWQEMVSAIWQLDPVTLPYTPVGTPENWQFWNVSWWWAIHQVFARLCVAAAPDPSDNSWNVVELGRTQPGLTDLEDDATLLYDGDEFTNRLVLPRELRIWRRNWFFARGAEPTHVRYDGLTYGLSSTDASTTSDDVGSIPGNTIESIWDDLPAVFSDGSSTPQTQSQMNDRDDDIAERRMRMYQTPHSHRIYQGIAEGVLPGSEVRAVLWRQFGVQHGVEGHPFGGLVTEVWKYPGPARVMKMLGGKMEFAAGQYEPTIIDSLNGPDFGRFGKPAWPPLAVLVEVQGWSEESPGDFVEPVGGVYNGLVVKAQNAVAGGSGVSLAGEDACWIVNGSSNASNALSVQSRYVAVLVGSGYYNSESRPTYVVCQGDYEGVDVGTALGGTVPGGLTLETTRIGAVKIGKVE